MRGRKLDDVRSSIYDAPNNLHIITCEKCSKKRKVLKSFTRLCETCRQSPEEVTNSSLYWSSWDDKNV